MYLSVSLENQTWNTTSNGEGLNIWLLYLKFTKLRKLPSHKVSSYLDVKHPYWIIEIWFQWKKVEHIYKALSECEHLFWLWWGIFQMDFFYPKIQGNAVLYIEFYCYEHILKSGIVS